MEVNVSFDEIFVCKKAVIINEYSHKLNKNALFTRSRLGMEKKEECREICRTGGDD